MTPTAAMTAYVEAREALTAADVAVAAATRSEDAAYDAYVAAGSSGDVCDDPAYRSAKAAYDAACELQCAASQTAGISLQALTADQREYCEAYYLLPRVMQRTA